MNKKQVRNSFSNPRTLRSMFSAFECDDELDDLILDRTEGWYDAKHSSFSCHEIEFVNSIKVTCCPYCGSDRFRKIPVGEWIEFLIHLFQYQSIKVASIDNRNAYSTDRYWLNKIFEVLKNYQASIVMGEKFWTDETYLKLMPKDLKQMTPCEYREYLFAQPGTTIVPTGEKNCLLGLVQEGNLQLLCTLFSMCP